MEYGTRYMAYGEWHMAYVILRREHIRVPNGPRKL